MPTGVLGGSAFCSACTAAALIGLSAPPSGPFLAVVAPAATPADLDTATDQLARAFVGEETGQQVQLPGVSVNGSGGCADGLSATAL